MEKIKIGISACLLGQNVRYNGVHKLDRFLAETLGQFVTFIPVCPETECGMGTPREPVCLAGEVHKPRLVTVTTNRDLTEQMLSWGRLKLSKLKTEELFGFIFKSKSPSCALHGVKVYDPTTMKSSNSGTGLFARIIMEHFPELPVEDEEHMHDPVLRENYIERIFVFKRWVTLSAQQKTAGKLVDFHTKHKMLFLAHSPKHYRLMGKLVSQNSCEMDIAEKYSNYRKLMIETLAIKCTVKKHVNVLQHIMGYFKKNISTDQKKELLETIDRYHEDHIPLIVPVTLINHYVRKYSKEYLARQLYLNPHPAELKLRNHV